MSISKPSRSLLTYQRTCRGDCEDNKFWIRDAHELVYAYWGITEHYWRRFVKLQRASRFLTLLSSPTTTYLPLATECFVLLPSWLTKDLTRRKSNESTQWMMPRNLGLWTRWIKSIVRPGRYYPSRSKTLHVQENVHGESLVGTSRKRKSFAGSKLYSEIIYVLRKK